MPQAHLICTTKQCNILESDFHIYRIKNRLFILCPLCSVSVFFFHFNINKIWTNNNHVLFVFYFLLLFEFFSALTFCLCPCTQDQLRGRPTVQKNKRKLRPPPWNHHNNKKNPKSENFIKKATNTPKLLVNKSTILIETHTTQKQPDSDWTAFSTKFTAVDCLFFFSSALWEVEFLMCREREDETTAEKLKTWKLTQDKITAGIIFCVFLWNPFESDHKFIAFHLKTNRYTNSTLWSPKAN